MKRRMEGSDDPDMVRPTDLPSQFEELLAVVWWAEKNWRFDDRLDLSLKLQPRADH